jgi:hypothetical protein
MQRTPCGKWGRLIAGALGVLLTVALAGGGEPQCCLSLEQLEHMSCCELENLFKNAEVGAPLVGCARGRLVYLADHFLPKVKLRVAKTVWEGKSASEDGSFVNLWAGNRAWIGSHYCIGPSWLDGRPAIIMEYPPGTKLFWNMHDELREVAPGLYLGPVYNRFPCPKFRGFVALESCAACCTKGH